MLRSLAVLLLGLFLSGCDLLTPSAESEPTTASTTTAATTTEISDNTPDSEATTTTTTTDVPDGTGGKAPTDPNVAAQSIADIEATLATMDRSTAELVMTVPEPGAAQLTGPQSLTFLWDTPIFPLAAPEALQQWLTQHATLTPAVDGAWQVIGTQGILFEPYTDLPRSTSFTLTLDSTVTGTQPLTHEFTTQQLQFTSVRGQHLFGRKPITLHFNQPVNIDDFSLITVTPALDFTAEYGVTERTLPDGTATETENQSQLVLTPQADWPLDTQFKFTMPSEFRALEGPLPARPSTKSIHTVKPFSLQCSSQNRDEFSVFQSTGISFTTPVDRQTLFDHLVVTPEPPAEQWAAFLQTLDQTHTSDTLTSLSFPPYDLYGTPFATGVAHTFGVDPALTDTFGQPFKGLTHCRDYFFTYPDHFSSIYWPQQGQVVTRSSVPPFGFRYSGDIVSARLIAQHYAPSAATATVHTADLAVTPDTTREFVLSLDLPTLLPDLFIGDQWADAGTYHFMVEAQYPPQSDNRPHPRFIRHQTHFHVTDFALTQQHQADAEHLITLSPIGAQPLPEGDIRYFSWKNDRNNTQYTDEGALIINPRTRQSDQQGTADTFPTFTLESSNPLQALWAQVGNQFGVVSAAFNHSLRTQNSDLKVNPNHYRQTMAGASVTDRPLYRPGDTVHLKSILREYQFFDSLPPYRPVTDTGHRASVSVRDPFHEVIFEASDLPVAEGSFDLSFDLPPQADLGSYRLQISATNGETTNGHSITFHVTEYRKPKFLIEADFSTDHAIEGDDLTATIRAEYLFGGPLKGKDGHYTLSVFGRENCRYWWGCRQRDIPLQQAAFQLDDQGQFTFTTPLELPDEEDLQFELLHLDVIVKEAADEQSSQRVSIPLAVADRTLTLRTDRHFFEPPQTITGQGTVTDLTESPLAQEPVTVTLSREQWVRNDRKNGRGDYQGEWRRDYVTTDETTVTTDKNGDYVYDFPLPEDGGTYRLQATVTDDADRPLSATTFTWVQQEVPERQRLHTATPNSLLELFTSAPEFTVGETAQVFFPATSWQPERAWAVLERGDVRSTNLLPTPEGTVIELPIEAWMVPNVYVSVLLEGTDADGTPQIRWGSVSVNVTDPARELEIDLDVPTGFQAPGDTVDVPITTTIEGQPVPAEVTVAVVDLSLLALKSRADFDLRQHFFQRLPLGVVTTHTLANFLSQQQIDEKAAQINDLSQKFSPQSPVSGYNEKSFDGVSLLTAETAMRTGGGGGGGGGTSTSKVSEFAPRGDFRDTALFVARVQTDDQGQATVPLQLPDNLTQWDVWAFAHTPDSAFGEAKAQIDVTKPLLIEPILPNIFREGDTAQIGVLVSRQLPSPRPADTPATEPVTVTLQLPDGLTPLGPLSQTVDVTDTARVFFTVESGHGLSLEPETPIELPITFTVKGEDSGHTDALQVTRRWHPPHVATTAAFLDHIDTTPLQFPIQSDVRALRSDLELTTYRSVLHSLTGLTDRTHQTDYGCTEQMFSALSSDLIEYDLFQAAGAETAEPDWPAYTKFLEILPQRIHRSGGVQFWPGSRSAPSPWVSARLHEAAPLWAQHGHPIPQTIVDGAMRYAWDQVKNCTPDNTQCWDGLTQYVLSQAILADPLTTDAQGRFDAMSKMTRSTESKVWFLLALQRAQAKGYTPSPALQSTAQELTDTLQRNLKVRERAVTWEETAPYYYSQPTRLSSLMLMLMLERDTFTDFLPQVATGLIGADRTSLSGSTAFRTLWALRDYVKAFETPTQTVDYQLKVGDQTLSGPLPDAHTVVTHQQSLPPQTVTPFTASPSPDGGKYYVEGTLREVFHADDINPVQKGFWIEREFFALDDENFQNPLTEFTVGQSYKVRLRVITHQSHRQVMIEDAVPSGFELVNFNLDNADQTLAQHATHTGEGRAHCRGWCAPLFAHHELWFDRARFFTDWLRPGTHEVVYIAQARITGEFDVPPAQVLEMYNPEVFAHGAGDRITITLPTE